MLNRSAAIALCALLAAFGAVPARAQDAPTGYGTYAASGSVFTTELSPGGTVNDTDEFDFQGFPGMSVTAVLKQPKGGTLQPIVEFLRPGGAVATDDDGFVATPKGTGVTATMVLDAAGWWVVRVRGVNLNEGQFEGVPPVAKPANYSKGPYSIQVNYKLPPSSTTWPFVGKGFAKKALIDSRADQDEYPFQVYAGQTITATLSIAKGSALFPELELAKPDGSALTGATVKAFDGKKATVTKYLVPQAEEGTWRLRVRGLEHPDDGDDKVNSNTTGAYALSVKLGKPTPAPSLSPDAGGQYRFLVPAAGEATIGWTFKIAGGVLPTFVNLLDSDGNVVGGAGGLEDSKHTSRSLRSLVVPRGRPVGTYVITFNLPAGAAAPQGASFSWRMIPRKPTKGVKVTISKDEPVIVVGGVTPRTGAFGSPITISTAGGPLLDPADPEPDQVAAFIDRIPIDDLAVNGRLVSGHVPQGLTVGLHDVVVRSSTGQLAVAPGAFEIIERPRLTGIEPNVGSFAGGYDITIFGEGFLDLTDPQIVINSLGNIVPVNIKKNLLTDTSITFVGPAYGTAGSVQFGVVDAANGVGSLLLPGSFEFISSPAISRLVPNLTSVLGGDVIIVTGANFQPTDHLFIETAPNSNAFVEIPNTYVSATRHQFTAPVRTKGSVSVYVVDQFNQPQPPRTRDLTYFQYTNLNTSVQGVLPSGADLWDGVTTTSADYDQDGFEDLFISRVGTGAVASSPQTRVLHNRGGAQAGLFDDVTATVMPAASTSDDWRADRIWVADMDRSLDGFPDMALVTNDNTVLPQTRSHVRILANEPRAADPNDRVFRDRTGDLFCPPRSVNGGSSSADNWRGLDMWVGDIDQAAGQPEIVIVHKEKKQELDVYCAPYCASPTASFYTYGFYWGGSREFRWDKSKAGGLGQYKFNRDFFPRKSAVRVPVILPGGGQLPICNANYGQPCVDRFTPFIGKRVAVADIDVDGNGAGLAGLKDVAVVSDETVQRIYPPSTQLTTISALQVGIQRFNPAEGSLLTDITHELTILGGDNRADAVSIGYPGYPDGAAGGFIAISKATPPGGLAIRIFKFKAPTVTSPPHFADFQDTTSLMMPALGPNDRWQASRIVFADVDADGDQDMTLVARASPGGGEPAMRILRNDVVNSQVGVFREGYRKLIVGDAAAGVPSLVGGNEFLEGDTFTLGDVNRDGSVDFILTRANTTAPAPETRIIVTDRGAP